MHTRTLTLLPLTLALFPLVACDGGDTDKPADTGDIDTGDTDTGSIDSSDTGETGDTVDTSGEDWSHCPDASTWVGDASWTAPLTVTSGAGYCAGSNEARSLPEELEAKAKFRVVAGSYTLPSTEGEGEMALPICTLRTDAARQVAMAGAGPVETSLTTYAGTTYTSVHANQPVTDGSGAEFELDPTFTLVGDEGATPNEFTLDGQIIDPTVGANYAFALYPSGGSPYDTSTQWFQPCDDSAWIRNIHTVTFAGGSVEITIDIGTDLVITAPAGFVHATGELDGTSFDITNYFQLIYRPGHHHFDRHFGVLFDAPIGAACGLIVEGVDGQVGTTTAAVSLTDCGLLPLETRATTAEDWSTVE